MWVFCNLCVYILPFNINSLLYLTIRLALLCICRAGSSIRAVRLLGGSVAREGRVEVKRSETWQSVCAQDWQWLASNLVCKSLNRGYALAWYKNSLYQGSGPLSVSPPLLCSSTSDSLGDCFELIPPSPANCTAENDEVGVVCSGSGLGMCACKDVWVCVMHGVGI